MDGERRNQQLRRDDDDVVIDVPAGRTYPLRQAVAVRRLPPARPHVDVVLGRLLLRRGVGVSASFAFGAAAADDLGRRGGLALPGRGLALLGRRRGGSRVPALPLPTGGPVSGRLASASSGLPDAGVAAPAPSDLLLVTRDSLPPAPGASRAAAPAG